MTFILLNIRTCPFPHFWLSLSFSLSSVVAAQFNKGKLEYISPWKNGIPYQMTLYIAATVAGERTRRPRLSVLHVKSIIVWIVWRRLTYAKGRSIPFVTKLSSGDFFEQNSVHKKNQKGNRKNFQLHTSAYQRRLAYLRHLVLARHFPPALMLPLHRQCL
jgi:hypothetical protein